jgi:hypothetical protein
MTMLASTPYLTAREAIDACQEGEVAILLDGMNLVLDRESAYELDAEGIEFAYLCYLMRSDGQRVVVTVPVN